MPRAPREPSIRAVLTTVSSLAQARRLARAVLAQPLVACVHIEPIESFYHWDGRLQHEREYRLMLKTTVGNVAATRAALRRLHPYELAAIYVIALSGVDPPYARWVEQNSRGARVRKKAAPKQR